MAFLIPCIATKAVDVALAFSSSSCVYSWIFAAYDGRRLAMMLAAKSRERTTTPKAGPSVLPRAMSRNVFRSCYKHPEPSCQPESL